MNLLFTVLMQLAMLAVAGAALAQIVGAHVVRGRLVQAAVGLVALAVILGPIVGFVGDRLRELETAEHAALGGAAPGEPPVGASITAMVLLMGIGHLAFWVWWRGRQRPSRSDDAQLREPRRHRPGEPGGGR